MSAATVDELKAIAQMMRAEGIVTLERDDKGGIRMALGPKPSENRAQEPNGVPIAQARERTRMAAVNRVAPADYSSVIADVAKRIG